MTTAWMNSPDRKCHNEPIDTFITPGDLEDEPPYPSPRAHGLCIVCPVRPDCLQYAIEEDIEYGVWGGMTAYQRELMTRKKSRKKCPGCGRHETIIHENGNDVCLGCGLSWPIW